MKGFIKRLGRKIKNQLPGISLHALEQKMYEREDSIRALPSAPERFKIESIKNLPIDGRNRHEWIEDFCLKCGRCIRKCPAEAIYKEPILHESGIITHIDGDKCFTEFAGNYGCRCV